MPEAGLGSILQRARFNLVRAGFDWFYRGRCCRELASFGGSLLQDLFHTDVVGIGLRTHWNFAGFAGILLPFLIVGGGSSFGPSFSSLTLGKRSQFAGLHASLHAFGARLRNLRSKQPYGTQAVIVSGDYHIHFS